MRDRAGAVLVEFLVVMRPNVATGKNLFEMLEERRIHRHDVLKVAMLRAILNHQDFAVPLDDVRLDLADFLVQ